MKLIEKLNVHVLDYTYDKEIDDLVYLFRDTPRVEVCRYTSVSNSKWSEIKYSRGNNLLPFLINQSRALKAISKSKDQDHIVMDSYISFKSSSSNDFEIPDRTGFYGFLNNGSPSSVATYHPMFYIQPHIAQFILSGYKSGDMNLNSILMSIPQGEVGFKPLKLVPGLSRYPNFTLNDTDLLWGELRDIFNSS